MPRRDWTRPELLQALRLYMRFPFGRLHGKNPEIIALAAHLGRTPNAIAMKACNFASLDEAITSTGRTGLSGASNADRELWSEFLSNPEAVANEIESTHDTTPLTAARATGFIPVADDDSTTSAKVAPTNPSLNPESRILNPPSDTEIERLTRTRRVQSFFRAAVLTSYNSRCAITRLAEPQLLNAASGAA